MKSIVVGLTVVLVTLTFLASDASAAEARRPNIVFFLVDDMGWQDTSVPFHSEPTALNRRYRTPNMERLAAQGMKFTQAYASAVCSPTRVSALTGMNAARHRVTNWTLRKNVSPDQPHPLVQPPAWNLNGICTKAGVERTMQVTPLPALLRDAGYRTLHVGKAHFGAKDTPGENPLNLGFDVNIAGHCAGGPGSYWGEMNFSAAWRSEDPADRIWDVPGLEAYHGTNIYLTEALTLEAIKAVEQSVADKTPFYLYMAHYAVHAPWEKDDRFYRKYVDAGVKPFEAAFASMIESMDKSLGDLMAALTRLGVADDTIILFMSDNGSHSQCPPNLPLRGHKLTPYEGGTRVPMLAKWPGVVKSGTTCGNPIIIEDIYPTILELAGVEWRGRTIQTVDGVSFVRLLKAKAPARTNRAFVWHFPHHYASQTPFSAIRIGAWKLIYHHADRRLELFNIDADISEKTDLAATEPQKVRELASKLTALLKKRGAQMPIDKQSGNAVPWPDEAKASSSAIGTDGRPSRPALSPTSKSAGRRDLATTLVISSASPLSHAVQVWKPAIQQTRRSALQDACVVRPRSAGFQACCIADFEVGRGAEQTCGLEHSNGLQVGKPAVSLQPAELSPCQERGSSSALMLPSVLPPRGGTPNLLPTASPSKVRSAGVSRGDGDRCSAEPELRGCGYLHNGAQ